ncbi:MAG: hypothetical protein Q4B80_04685 [Aerococcaceae bacterium]|nr:hypothetical protein [Aerococcaceae bacterium]
MNLGTILSEWCRFIKAHCVKIILGAFIVCAAVVAGRYYLSGKQQHEQQEAYDYLQHIYQQEPAEVQFVINNEDGTLFSNSYVIDEYFAQANVVAEIERQTGIEFGDWIQHERTLKLYKTAQFRGGLAVLRNSSSDLMTLRVLVGKTAEENKAIATAYATLLQDKALPFLRKQTVTLLNTPEVIEYLDPVMQGYVATPTTLSVYTGPSTKSLAVYGVLGLIVGTLLTTVFLFVKRLMHPRIEYAFDYGWEMDDTHIVCTPEDDGMARVVALIADETALVVAQESLETLHTETQITAKPNAKRIVIIIQSGVTTKQWYHAQQTFARALRLPVTIIHHI